MLVRVSCQVVVLLALAAAAWLAASSASAEELPQRVSPWNSSRIKGSPDPPLPFTTRQVFRKVKLDRPTNITWLPTAQKWVANHADDEIVAFGKDHSSAMTEPLVTLSEFVGKKIQTGYATKFHYDLAKQPWCFVTYTSPPQAPKQHHLARLRVLDPAIPTFDPDSLTVLASWKGRGHVGSSMQFGPDGMFYVSIGDGQPPYPPDEDGTGQDLSDLRSSILRIDVDSPTAARPYRIPADNPFVNHLFARDEIWAFGFRNPWKIAFDPESGDLLAADVGWEMRELVHRVQRGGNYGWSIMEGSQPVKQQDSAIPITRPLIEHTHLESRSITGGHFWHSERIPELVGAYIYGDWMTGKVWALKYQGNKVIWQQELVDTPYRVICFMLDPAGEVLIVAYGGTIHRLERNTTVASQKEFPTRLSQTGLFEDVAAQQPATGVVEYRINATRWADGTHSRQWIGIPGKERLTLFEESDWTTGQSAGRFQFPHNTVVAKTVSYRSVAGDPASEKHLETQLLHRRGDEWRAYNYVWNEEQTDAVLQADEAIDRRLVIRDPSAPNRTRTQIWRHASRSECLLCHIWAGGTVHGFWPPQLKLSDSGTNQLDHLTRLGLFAADVRDAEPVASPADSEASLETRARSYLAVNCSTCHRPQGGGTANFNFEILRPVEDNYYLNALPAQGTFGIRDARVVAPGDPWRSVLLYRALKSGRGHMPQFGSQVIDRTGVRMLHDWIAAFDGTESQPSLAETIDRLNGAGKLRDLVEVMLDSVEEAMSLSLACGSDALDPGVRATIIELGAGHSDAPIRDLFEHYLPEDQRTDRLGPTIDEPALLALEGSAERGEQLFQHAQDVNCRACHRIGMVGQRIGPDLPNIGTLQTPAEILGNILRPSEKIDPKYRARQIVTIDGQVLFGIVSQETRREITLTDATGKTSVVSKNQIDEMRPALESAMPQGLLAGLTPQQAADLLAYLGEQRAIGPDQHRRAKVKRTSEAIKIDGVRDDSAWQKAESIEPFVFTWWKDGDPPPQQTDVRLLWDDEHLYVSFVCQDQDVIATRRGRDSKVYRDDCVEVFASPELDQPRNYFNLEMNALGEQLDQYRPHGQMLPNWDPDGIQIAVKVDGTINDSADTDQGWSLEVAIPFRLFAEVLPEERPRIGDQWRLNLSRLENEMALKSQWSRGDRNFPRFHHPEYFGFVEFVD